MDGADCEVVGVMPPAFAFPERTSQVWQPLGTYLSPERLLRHDTHFLHVIGRLKPGVSFNQGRAEIDAISARLPSSASR